MSAAGLLAIVKGNLAPAWYGSALLVLALPISWVGGQLYARCERARADALASGAGSPC